MFSDSHATCTGQNDFGPRFARRRMSRDSGSSGGLSLLERRPTNMSPCHGGWQQRPRSGGGGGVIGGTQGRASLGTLTAWSWVLLGDAWVCFVCMPVRA